MAVRSRRRFGEVRRDRGSPARIPAHLHRTLASESLDDWKAWAAWKVLHARSPYLHSALVDETFAFYGTTLSGTEENRERWKRGVSLVQDLLGEAVGKLYVDRHFPAEAKTRMLELVANLQEAYRRNISDLEWMSPQTREAALAKLEKFTPKIGYPDKCATTPDSRSRQPTWWATTVADTPPSTTVTWPSWAAPSTVTSGS